jgi:hypothetical protein
MKTKRFNLFTAIFAVLISVSSANAQLLEMAGKWLIGEYIKDKEVRKQIQEIQPTYDGWIKSLEDYISKTGKVGDCKTIEFRLLSNNRDETPNFSYECGIENGNIAFLYAKNKIKIGNCDIGSTFKAEFDIRKNELNVFSAPMGNDACVFFQPRCKTLISGSCPANMVFVGGQTFLMGCDYNRDNTNKIYCPWADASSHKVTVNSFCIGKYEVTQKEWQEVMGRNPSKFQNCGGNCPVEQVSWNDAQAFIGKLNAKTSMDYRLPTEAEWEYAARGGCKEVSGFDENYVAWYSKNSNNQTHAVGGKQQNTLGIYDMIGNVGEWVNDWYGIYNKSEVDNPKGPNSGSNKVARGCTYNNKRDGCHTRLRFQYPPNTSKDILGFRLVHLPIDKAVLQKKCQNNGKVWENDACREKTSAEIDTGKNACKANGKVWENNACREKTSAEIKAADQEALMKAGTKLLQKIFK